MTRQKLFTGHNQILTGILFVVTILTILFRYALPIRDSDVWFHMLYGKYFIDNTTLIPDHTIYSWTQATNDVVYCSWLPDIVLYFLHSVAGVPGLIFFRYTIVFFFLFAFYRFVKSHDLIDNPLSWLMFLLACLMSYCAIFAKPEIISYFFMIFISWNWWYIRTSDKSAWRRCYLFPIILIIWVNSHGGVVFGCAFLALVFLGELINTKLSPANVLSSKVRKHLFWASVLCVIVMFVNPYGYNYILQLINFFMPTKANLASITNNSAYSNPFKPNDNLGLILPFNIGALLLIVLFIRNIKKIEWSMILSNLFFIFLYSRYYRTTFYWPPVFLFSALSLLSYQSFLPKLFLIKSRIMLLNIVILFSILILSANSIYKAKYYPENDNWMGYGISNFNPIQETAYIKKHFPSARIGNTYDQGAYLLWELWPENKVFIDARWFPYIEWEQEYWKAFHKTYKNNYAPELSTFIEKYDCDIWVITHMLPLITQWFYISSEWNLVFYGVNSAVFIKKDIPIPQDIFPRRFDNIKNFHNGLKVLEWSLAIKDWKAAEKIIKTMQDKFRLSSQREKINKIEHLYHYLKKTNKNLIFSS